MVVTRDKDGNIIEPKNPPTLTPELKEEYRKRQRFLRRVNDEIRKMAAVDLGDDPKNIDIDISESYFGRAAWKVLKSMLDEND